MGKLILISGQNDSGKSRYAEGLLARFPGDRYYLATMIPQTAENRARIEKHRAQRAGLHFRLLERPDTVGDAPVGSADAVLLEDVSNLLANAVFERRRTDEAVFSDLLALRDRCALLVAVTISGLAPEDVSDGETAAYIAALNRLNERLLDAADAAAGMRDRAPNAVKGEVESVLEVVSGGLRHL